MYTLYQLPVIDTDRYGNASYLVGTCPFLRWMANVDPGYPMNRPDAGGVMSTLYCENILPEQIKYVTSLSLNYFDPNRFPEVYVFLPALRRSLRLSSAARCAPFNGQDFANDDIAPVPLPPTWFQSKYDGNKKLLMFFYYPTKNAEQAAALRKNYYGHYGQFLMPKPFMGRWQVDKYQVLEMSRLPRYKGGYCYSKRLIFFQPQEQLKAEYETWDQGGKYWRTILSGFPALKEPDGSWFDTIWSHCNIDFPNNHTSCARPPLKGIVIDQETPKKLANYHRYGTPAGLDEIMQ